MWQQVEGFPRPSYKTVARARSYLLMASGWRYGPCVGFTPRTTVHLYQHRGYKGIRRPRELHMRLHHPSGVVASAKPPTNVVKQMMSRRHVIRTPAGQWVLSERGLKEAALIAMTWRSTYGADIQLPVVPEWPDHPSRPGKPWERAWKMGFTARSEAECPYPNDPNNSARRTYRRHWLNGFRVSQHQSTVGSAHVKHAVPSTTSWVD
jgi:ribosome modulation factor